MMAVVSVIALLALMAPSASADGITASIYPTGWVVQKVAVRVWVQFACPVELNGGAAEVSTLTVRQAVGKQIASAEEDVSLGYPLVCDGTTRSIATNLFADPSGPPFHAGTAVASLNMAVTDQFWSQWWYTSDAKVITLKTK